MEVSRQHQLVFIWFVWKLVKLFACFVKLYEIRRTVIFIWVKCWQTIWNSPNWTFICKNKPKTVISKRLSGVSARNSTLHTPNFHLIQRNLAPDLAVGAPTAGDALRGRIRGGHGYPPNVAGHGDMQALRSVWASSNLVVEISSPCTSLVRPLRPQHSPG
jgi:hypothetical protein